MAASPIDCIFTMPRATARLTAFLQGGRAQGAIIHCKSAVDLFCGRPRARRSQDGTFSPPWRLLGCPKRPQEKFCKSEGATKMAASSIHCIFTGSRDHLDEGRKILKTVFNVRTFLKSSFQCQGRSTARIPAFLQGAVATSSEGRTRPQKSL